MMDEEISEDRLTQTKKPINPMVLLGVGLVAVALVAMAITIVFLLVRKNKSSATDTNNDGSGMKTNPDGSIISNGDIISQGNKVGTFSIQFTKNNTTREVICKFIKVANTVSFQGGECVAINCVPPAYQVNPPIARNVTGTRGGVAGNPIGCIFTMDKAVGQNNTTISFLIPQGAAYFEPGNFSIPTNTEVYYTASS